MIFDSQYNFSSELLLNISQVYDDCLHFFSLYIVLYGQKTYFLRSYLETRIRIMT